MAAAHLCSSLHLSFSATAFTNQKLQPPKCLGLGTTFATGAPLLKLRSSSQRKKSCKASPVSIRCESSQEGSGLDTWLGRGAMGGFASVIAVEVATGRGLLENFGLSSPLPTVALAVASLVGVLTAVFIYQSASKN